MNNEYLWSEIQRLAHGETADEFHAASLGACPAYGRCRTGLWRHDCQIIERGRGRFRGGLFLGRGISSTRGSANPAPRRVSSSDADVGNPTRKNLSIWIPSSPSVLLPPRTLGRVSKTAKPSQSRHGVSPLCQRSTPGSSGTQRRRFTLFQRHDGLG